MKKITSEAFKEIVSDFWKRHLNKQIKPIEENREHIIFKVQTSHFNNISLDHLWNYTKIDKDSLQEWRIEPINCFYFCLILFFDKKKLKIV
jgi:hypothetical protein